MKVAVLCNGLGVVHRGSETFALEFEKHLKNDFDIQLFGVKDTSSKTREQIKVPWRNGRAYVESYLFGKHLYIYDMLKRVDLIFNNSGFPCSYWCNKIRKKHGIPFITRARGGGREETLSKYFKPDLMVFLTDYHRKQIGYKKSTVINNAVDIPTERTEIDEKYKHIQKPIFLSTSALVSFKRIHLIIDAVSKLEKGTLIQTSDGNMKDEICSLGHSKLKERFVYTGKIPKKELLGLYDFSDVFVHAAKQDAFPNVYLEALSHNLPIVAEKNKRSKEILGESSILVDCSDIEKFTDALKTATKTEWNNKSIKKAKEYSWDEIKKKYIQTFNEVIEK
jgi:glycosyltransferase involved in cell wall biosynthesis